MFKVYFKLKDTEYEIVAKDLDLSHPYFVSIKDFMLDYDEGLVVNPHLENTRKRFKDIETIMIPFQSCTLIEKVPEKKLGNDNLVSMNTLGRNSEK
jgi:hypothetical protein